RRVAVLGARTDPFTAPYVQDSQDAAVRLGLQLQPVLIDGPRDFEGAFAEMSKMSSQAGVIQPLFQPHTSRILEPAGKHRLAVMSSYRDTTQAGGLISYSADPRRIHSARGRLRRQDPQGRKTGQPSGRATGEVRARRQFEDRAGPWT